MSYGVPVHLIAASVANGPKSSTPIFASEAPRPVTLIESEIVPPGSTTSSETVVDDLRRGGDERGLRRRAALPVNAAVCGAAAIDSR